jgi:hypothetical protein
VRHLRSAREVVALADQRGYRYPNGWSVLSNGLNAGRSEDAEPGGVQ